MATKTMTVTSKLLQSTASKRHVWFNSRRIMSYSGLPIIRNIESQNVYIGNTENRPTFTSTFSKHVFLHHRARALLQNHLMHQPSYKTCHTSARQLSVKKEDDLLGVEVQGRTLDIPFVWLRDHCRSERYYNQRTSQKNVDLDLLDRDLVPESVEVKGDSILINWKDGHRSEFSSQWLLENSYPGQYSRRESQTFWDAKIIAQNIPTTDYNHYMGSDSGLANALHDLAKWGFCLVDGAPATEDGTQEVVERMAFIKQSQFGIMNTFTSDKSRCDTGYDNTYLGPHTDTTYMDSPAGLQVFHCLEHQGTGGETLLVDGYNAAEQLRLQHPREFEILCSTNVPHKYIEAAGDNHPGYQMYDVSTVLTLHPASKEICRIRFNPYDRATLNTVEPQHISAFYRAYDTLTRIINDTENRFWIKLTPGKVIFIDNWRVLHGRAAFDGKRVMTGCYVGRDEWVSKARVTNVF